MHLVHRKTCRTCGLRALHRVIDLGEQHLQGSFVKPGKVAPRIRKIRRLRQRECDAGPDTDQPYRHLQRRSSIHCEDLNRLLRELRSAEKHTYIYGASTKGNTILQRGGIDRRVVDAATERDPAKYSARTPGTDIQIISEEESLAMQPDCYIVLPRHFREEFLEREREVLRRGSGMISPLPQVEVISARRRRSSRSVSQNERKPSGCTLKNARVAEKGGKPQDVTRPRRRELAERCAAVAVPDRS